MCGLSKDREEMVEWETGQKVRWCGRRARQVPADIIKMVHKNIVFGDSIHMTSILNKNLMKVVSACICCSDDLALRRSFVESHNSRGRLQPTLLLLISQNIGMAKNTKLTIVMISMVKKTFPARNQESIPFPLTGC